MLPEAAGIHKWSGALGASDHRPSLLLSEMQQLNVNLRSRLGAAQCTSHHDPPHSILSQVQPSGSHQPRPAVSENQAPN